MPWLDDVYKIAQAGGYKVKIKTIAGREGWLEKRSRSTKQEHQSRAGSIGFRAPAYYSCSFFQTTLPYLQFAES